MSRPVFLALASSLCVGATFLLFGAALGEFFILDDFVWLQCAHDTVNNEASHIFTRHINFFFRPVVHALFGLLYALAGPDPALFHGATLVLHGLAAALLGLLARELSGGATWRGLLASLTFVLIHPAYGEAMVWVSAASEPLVAIFSLLAALTWLRALSSENPRRGPWLYLAYLSALLALCSKESAVTLWPLLILMQLVLSRLGKLAAGITRSTLWLHLPFLVLLASYLIMQFVVQQQSPLVRSGMYSLHWKAGLLLFNCLTRLAIAGGGPLLVALLLLLAARFLGWQARPVTWRPLLITSMGLLGGVLLALLPYAWFKGEMVASRYFYQAALLVALAPALALAPISAVKGWRVGVAALLVLAAGCLDGVRGARQEMARYRLAATPVERFVKAAARIKLGGKELLIINSPLRGLHLRGAMYVFHPDHTIRVWGTHRNRIPPPWGKRRVMRWDPVSGHFRKIQ